MKRLLFILAVLLVGLASSAQRKLEKEEFYLGAQGGYMASMVNFSPVVGQMAKHSFFGPTAGLVFRYAGHKACALQLEVNYMQRGWQECRLMEVENATGDRVVAEVTGYSRQLDYVEVPMLFHLYFGRKFRGFLNLGPQIGYLVHESQKNVPDEFANAWEDNLPSKTAHQYARAEKPFDWGLAGGLGMYYRSKYAGVYQIEARFNYSLGGVFRSTQMDYFSMCSPMNLSLTFAYMWQLHPHFK